MNIISENFEMRFISHDERANGETDFKGETSILSTQERIDYLNAYAQKTAEAAEDFSLDNPVVTLEEARRRLKQIKPLPLCEKRRRIVLDEWKWIGYTAQEKQKRCRFRPGATRIEKQDWRCFMEWEFTEHADYANCEFSLGTAAKVGFDAQRHPWYISDGNRVLIDGVTQVRRMKLELDFVCRKWNLCLNDELYADFADFSDPDAEEADCFMTSIPEERTVFCRIRGVGYHRLTDNDFEPFSIKTFLDEDFKEPVSMDGWNQGDYDDSGWQPAVLPIVHGGERYAGQDIYLRREVVLDELMPYTELYLESLTPGGEVYINGRLAAFIKDECCHKIDVSDYVKAGKNLLAVRVYADEIKPEDKMTHTHTDLHTGWFAGRMHLDLLPEIYIEDAYSWTEFIGENEAVQKVRVSVKARRAMASARAKEHEISVCMMPWFPEEEKACAGAAWRTPVTPNLTAVSEGALHIKNPCLWSPENPQLYKLVVQLKSLSGTLVDDYVITAGIRTVSQEGGIFRINGKPQLLKAPLLFGARPPFDKIAAWDRCPPAEFYVQEMLMVQKMNGNGFRMSVHDKRIGGSNDPRICEIADQMGIMLVWQTSTWIRVTSATNINLEELACCIRQVRNHCSIVIWQPSNHPSWKNWDTVMRVYRMLYDTIRKLDCSRLISPSADSRRIRPRWDDGLTDFDGNRRSSCDPVWTAEGICRGNMDYILGYGNDWSALRQWPCVEKKNLPDYMESTEYIPSFLNSTERAYFNFEHDEIIGQPNWNIHKGKPSYHVNSYEKYYEEGSIGRPLSFDEWLTSQAWQALGAYETICKCRWLDYDGLCWCNLRGGLNTGTYQKSIIDYFGQPKLAWYAHRMAFQNVLACSQNVDMVYGPKDTVPVIVMNIGESRNVSVSVEVTDGEKRAVYRQTFENVVLQEGRSVTRVADMKLPKLPEGLYTLQYTVYG